MSTVALSLLMAVAAAPRGVAAGFFANPPLASLSFPQPSDLPYQIYPPGGAGDSPRGPNYGYNICNSTTENQDSLCQTAFFNDLSDFCIFAPPEPNTDIADSEGIEVSWCTKKGHGGRLIPEGALQGAQLLQTPDYLQLVAFIDQTKINMPANDTGGELDPHGADGVGNPIGGQLYSSGLPHSNGTVTQVHEWHLFLGGGAICMRVCDPQGNDPAGNCQHIFDRIGCNYNDPNTAQNGTFEVCQADDSLPPGVYVQNGQTLTYTQPAESLGPITSIPYTPSVPASSNCVTYTSASLYTDLAAVDPTPTSSSSGSGTTPAPTGHSGSSGSGSGSPGASRTGSSGSPSATGGAAGQGNGAGSLHISAFATLAGVLFAAVFLS